MHFTSFHGLSFQYYINKIFYHTLNTEPAHITCTDNYSMSQRLSYFVSDCGAPLAFVYLFEKHWKHFQPFIRDTFDQNYTVLQVVFQGLRLHTIDYPKNISLSAFQFPYMLSLEQARHMWVHVDTASRLLNTVSYKIKQILFPNITECCIVLAKHMKLKFRVACVYYKFFVCLSLTRNRRL